MRFADLSVLKHCSVVVFLMKYPKSFFVFLLLGTSCIAILCRVLSAKHVQVIPLFHSESPVIEISNGSLDTFHALLEMSSLHFVMYYTHWCAQSRKLVSEFHRASKMFEGQVFFIAINCWTGSCRQNYLFHLYPQLFFYHTSYQPLEYKGRHKTGHLIRFLKMAMHPFTYISNNNILQTYLDPGKPSLLAFFNGTNYEDEKYNTFFGAALHSLNKATSLQFGVITCFQVAALVDLEKFGQVVLLNAFDIPQIYPSSLNYTYIAILQWAEQHKAEYVKELDPDLTNANEFGSKMKNGASLILFVSCKSDKNSSEALLRLYHQVALNYNNCSCKTPSQNVTRDAFPATTTAHASRDDAHEISCGVRLENALVTSCQSLPLSHGNRVQNVCDVCRECHVMCSCDVNSLPLRTSTWTVWILRNLSPLRDGCSSLRENYQGGNVLSVCCFQNSVPRYPEMILSRGDASRDGRLRALADDFGILNSENIQEAVSRNNPGILKRLLGNLMTMFSSNNSGDDKKLLDDLRDPSMYHNVSQVPVYPEYGTCERRGKVRVFDGAGCYGNVTVNFYFMDSRRYWSYALALGVKRDLPAQVALVIVDVKNEAQYVLPENTEITNTSIVDFVMKFTRGNLTRRLRSAPVPTQSCFNDGCIVEVVSSTFAQLVLDTHKDVFLMYYTPWCGFCRSAKPIYLALADHYKHSAHVRIARINADINDLAWEYTMDSYPIFIFFPAKRKDLSVTFPDDEERSLENLVRFVEKHKRGHVSSTWQENVTWLDHVACLRLRREKEALRKQNGVLRWRLRNEMQRSREVEKERLADKRRIVELLDERINGERSLFVLKDDLQKRTLENVNLFKEVPAAKLKTQKPHRKMSERTVIELRAKKHELERVIRGLRTENFKLSKEPPATTENTKQ